jgi:hypothetical protein
VHLQAIGTYTMGVVAAHCGKAPTAAQGHWSSLVLVHQHRKSAASSPQVAPRASAITMSADLLQPLIVHVCPVLEDQPPACTRQHTVFTEAYL